MKTDTLQHLLDGYREGTLSDNERTELEQLSRRDKVMAEASRRADGIVRRRRAAIFSLTGLLLVGATVWSLLPREQAVPLVAEAAVPEIPIVSVEPTVEEPAVEPPVIKDSPKHAPHRRTVSTSQEPVVMCNNQCEADSVISDIWKFLTV